MKTQFEKKISFDLAHVYPRKYKNLHNLPHWHKEHELILVESGNAQITLNDNTFTLTEGSAAFFHSEDVHSIDAASDTIISVAKLDPAFFYRIIGEKRLKHPILQGEYDLPRHMADLFSELKTPTEYGGIIADSLSTLLIAQIFRQEQTDPHNVTRRDTTEQLRGLLERISKDHAYITFEDAAQYMHFSKPYFSEFFYTHTGMTFTHYLNVTKIQSAIEKLHEGSLTVTEISKSCGFNTIRNFNRVFKEQTGYTPRTLPKDYRFAHPLWEYSDSDFDPTLLGSEVLDT